MRTIRVLLVDDSEEFLNSAVRFLANDSRVSVVGRASGGQEGIRLAGELGPDLVLIDLVMPVMNGLVATRLIKELPAPPLVAIVTLHDGPEYQRSAEEAGGDAFLSKSRFAECMPALLDAVFTRLVSLPVPEETP